MSLIIDTLDGVTISAAIKEPVKAATTADIALSGLQTVDGVSLAADDRVLVKNQTDAAENGIYLAQPTSWSRAPDFDGDRDVVDGTVVWVTNGTANAGLRFRMTGAGPTDIGTSPISFAPDDGDRRAVSVTQSPFNATGDGATDDAKAIQAATNAVAANGGGILYFPPGTYLIGTAISLPSNVTLRGAGIDATTIRASGTNDIFALTGTIGVAVGLAADAAAGEAAMTLDDAGGFAAGDDLLIVGATSQGADSNVEINRIASIASNTLTFERDLYDAYAAAAGAFVQKVTLRENVLIENLTLQGVSSARPGGAGVNIDYARNVTLRGVRALDLSAGLISDYAETVAVLDCTLHNTYGAIQFHYTKYPEVRGCLIDETGGGGVVVYYNSDGARIVGNTLRNIAGYPLQANYNSQNAVFENNHLSNWSGGYGILVDFASDHARIAGNTLRNGGSVGIHISDNYSVCEGNTISGMPSVGIQFEGASYCRCIGNFIEDSGTTTSHQAMNWSGSIAGMSYNVCMGNVTKDGTGTHIQVDGGAGGGTSNIFEGNAISDIAYRGITVGNLDYTLCRNNTFDGPASAGQFLVADVRSYRTMAGDGTLFTPTIDLSGPAITEMLYNPPSGIKVFRVTVMASEATSADDGVRVLVTTTAGGGAGAIADFAAGRSSALRGLSRFATRVYVADNAPTPAVKRGGAVAAGDALYWHSAGGKTGAGKIMLQLDYISLGSS